ncbi:MAG: arginine--tRNA ligase, partial [Verrucomicrobiota bacterium]
MKETIEKKLTNWAGAGFAACFPDDDLSGVNRAVVPTVEEKFGDYQCNAAMGMARALKKNPREIAQTFVDRTELPEGVDRVELAGPGFINLFLDTTWLAAQADAALGEETLAVPEYGAGKTVVIDYSSPNVAKPMHIGHIRSTVIGNALDRMHRALGFKVVADNHLGDWGTQFGLILLGFKTFLDQDALETNPVEELERIYVKSYTLSKEDESWLARAKEELVKLQQGDEENLTLWQQFVDLSLGEFDKTYQRLGVAFDEVRGESFYNDRLPGILDELKEKGLAVESEGA